MKTLKTLSAFVKTVYGWDVNITYSSCYHSIKDYDKLLDSTVTLSQFIPCENGKPLEKPMLYCDQDCNPICCCSVEFTDIAERYQKACDAVLFEGWEIAEDYGEKGYVLSYGIGFYINVLIYPNETRYTFDGQRINTLHDLAESTTENPLKLKQ